MWNQRIVHVAIFAALSVPGLSKKPNDCQHIDRECDSSYIYRSINGSCNNLKHPTWAMAETPYDRILPNRYSDGIHEMPKSVTGKDLPLARKISNVMDPPDNRSDTEYTIGLMQFGQLLTHDITRLGVLEEFDLQGSDDCCEVPKFGSMGTNGKDFNKPVCAAIVPPPHDPVYTKAGLTCGDFARGATSLDIKCTTPKEIAQPLTVVTGYADLSTIYGSNEKVANSLRVFDKGLLKTNTRENQNWPSQDTGRCPLQDADAPCYKLGDSRVKQNPQLAALHIAYYRYHNIFAKLLNKVNPHWDDEKLYQEARRINIAMYQHVIFNEYIPRMIGEEYSYKNKLKHKSSSCTDDYNKKTDASTILEFASAAFRAPHTTIVGNLQLIDKDRQVVGDLRISDFILKPSILENKTDGELNYDNLVRGLSYQPQDRADTFNVETKHFLFKGTGEFGLDLRSSDIQRDRDHGVGWYTKARKLCNLFVPKTFKDLRKIMSEKNADKLKSLYDKVEDIELSVGGLAEPIAEDARVGETNRCILKLQFLRTRTGDRFFYDNCERHAFTKEQLKVIKKATFACLLCDTSHDVETMQPSAFDLVGKKNKVTSCKKLCKKIVLEAWKEKKPKKCKDKCHSKKNKKPKKCNKKSKKCNKKSKKCNRKSKKCNKKPK